jgi:methylthioribose-1-phosphate isomerase
MPGGDADAAAPPPLHWDGERLHALDQTRLPHEVAVLELTGAADTAEAIARLAIRGAPLIGIAAGYGLAMAVSSEPGLGALERGAELLRSARPTAVNLAWAVDRVADAGRDAGPAQMAAAARAEAEAIEAETIAAGEAIGAAGADLLAGLGARRLLTHCNTGALAAGGRASALGVALTLAERSDDVHVLVCETRPLLQGARLTTWELAGAGVPHALIVDGAAAGLIARGEVDAVLVGADRIAANGDVANKVGTYAHALAAQASGVPFVVVAPTATIDPATATGSGIAIEEREPSEVDSVVGVRIAPAGTVVRNPAFDVTPAGLVTALVTERGIARPVDAAGVRALLA